MQSLMGAMGLGGGGGDKSNAPTEKENMNVPDGVEVPASNPFLSMMVNSAIKGPVDGMK